ncbi:MAG: hypothetical protein MUC36_05275 [Planctomycetes bacterium]|jgi:hypothetical protein|nr:hypothetical protein [Planctomycetota bacterium]
MKLHAIVVVAALLVGSAPLPSQVSPTAALVLPLRTEPPLPAIERLVATAGAAPAADAPLSSFAAACLGRLRLGDGDGSRLVLALGRERLTNGEHAPHAVAWLVAAHLWHRRATGTQATSASGLAELSTAMERAAARPSAATFAAESLLVHGMFCLADLLDADAEGAHHLPQRTEGPGARWTARAVERQFELERHSWQPGRGHFRPHPCRGDLALPEPPDATLLLPAAAGMLLATGDRLARHLQTVLAAPLVATDEHALDGFREPLLRLVASSQLGGGAERAEAWTTALADHTAAPGFALDALLFAVTGARLASGAGLDERWLRLRPWLPPGLQRLEVPHLLAGGATFALQLRADGERAAFVITRLDQGRAACTLVVDDGAAQHLRIVRGGESFAGASARPQPEAQHQLPLGGDHGRR